MSGNEHKIKEVQRILDPVGVDIVPVSRKIEELQTQDVHALVRDKLIKAFHEIGRPLFVEHTGLYLRGLNGLPAGLTQIFWDRLEARRFADLVAALGDGTRSSQRRCLGTATGARCTCSKAPSRARFRAHLLGRRTSSGTACSSLTATRGRLPKWVPKRTTYPCAA